MIVGRSKKWLCRCVAGCGWYAAMASPFV